MKLEGQFKIAEPCHENWENMTPESKGRFCASCQKCVIDFSNMTKPEIKEAYDKENGDICARISIKHLQEKQRPAIRASFSKIGGKLKRLQAFGLALILAFRLNSVLQAQAKPTEIVMGKIAYVPPSASVRGVVKWDGGDSASEMEVQILQGSKLVGVAYTSGSGNYVFHDLKPGKYTIKVLVQYGRPVIETVVVGKSDNKIVNLTLHEIMMLGDTIYVPESEAPIESNGEIEVPSLEENIQIVDGELDIIDETANEIPMPLPITLPKEELCKCLPEKEIEIPSLENLVQPISGESNLEASKDIVEDESAPILVKGYEIRVFPNPVLDQLSIAIREKGEGDLKVKVLNIEGKEMLRKNWHGPELDVYKIDMQNWPAGTYMLEIDAGDVQHHQKLIKF